MKEEESEMAQAAAQSSKLVVRHLREMEFEIEHEGWKLLIDIPKEYGGSGKLPSPTDLLLGALAACKLIFGMSWADREGLDLSGLEAEAEPKMAAAPKRIEEMKIVIKGAKARVGDKIDAFRRAIEACTVANTFKTPPKMETVIE